VEGVAAVAEVAVAEAVEGVAVEVGVVERA
jgi:hypothetical protein